MNGLSGALPSDPAYTCFAAVTWMISDHENTVYSNTLAFLIHTPLILFQSCEWLAFGMKGLVTETPWNEWQIRVFLPLQNRNSQTDEEDSIYTGKRQMDKSQR